MEPETDKLEKRWACECGKLATWLYMPSCDFYPYVCDDCVSRGCSCMEEYDEPEHSPIMDTIKWFDENGGLWRWKEEGKSIEHIDEKGRLLPCCEYFHSLDGWEVANEEIKEFEKKGLESKTILVKTS